MFKKNTTIPETSITETGIPIETGELPRKLLLLSRL
jgi:hypothetical protein